MIPCNWGDLCRDNTSHYLVVNTFLACPFSGWVVRPMTPNLVIPTGGAGAHTSSPVQNPSNAPLP